MEVAVTSDLKLSAFYSEATSSLDQRFHLVGLFMCCKIIFTIPHIPESQKDLCLYAGMRLKHTAFFLPLWVRLFVMSFAWWVGHTRLFMPILTLLGHGSFLCWDCKSSDFRFLAFTINFRLWVHLPMTTPMKVLLMGEIGVLEGWGFPLWCTAPCKLPLLLFCSQLRAQTYMLFGFLHPHCTCTMFFHVGLSSLVMSVQRTLLLNLGRGGGGSVSLRSSVQAT